MRIISGSHKGKRLIAPRNLPVRPTTDFAKEGLFNILRNHFDLDEVTVLDLFTGTGNISFEFASRGAEHITSVDAHYGCVKFVQKIAEELDFPITTIKADVFKYIASQRGTFDVVFADPPYNFDIEQFEELVGKIFGNNLIKSEGLLIIEHSKHTDLSSLQHYTEERRYGGSVFSFFS